MRLEHPAVAPLALLVVSTLAIAIYAPALSGPWLLDDYAVFEPLLSALAEDGLTGDALASASGLFKRPLAMLSFAASAIWHGQDFWYWKATNLALHIANGWLVYVFGTLLARACAPDARPPRLLMVLLAGVWLVHPLNVSTVMYTVQRMTLLATLFTLATLCGYLHGRLREHGSRASAWALLCGIPAAVLCKENGILIPYFILILEVTVLAGHRRPRWLSHVLAAITVLPLVGAIALVLGPWWARLIGSYAWRNFDLAERLLSQSVIVVDYLRWIVMPRARDLGFYHDDIAPLRSIFAPGVVPSLTLILLLIVAAWTLRKRQPLVAAGIAFFFVGHALESSVLPLELAFEHRNYLPAVGVWIAVTAVLASALGQRRALALLVLCAGLFGGVTLGMTPLWGDATRLHDYLFKLHSDSVRARVVAVEQRLANGRYAQAAQLLAGRREITLRLQAVRLSCLRDRHAGGDASEALADLGRQPRIEAMALTLLQWLAEQARYGTCAIDPDALLAALRTNRDRSMSPAHRLRLYIAAAHLNRRIGNVEQALADLEGAARLAPADPYAWFFAAEVAAESGQLERAQGYLARASALPRAARPSMRRLDAAVRAMLPSS